METWLDLHIHTKYSMDGQFEPADLMRQCADAKVQAVAVTDHDSTGPFPKHGKKRPAWDCASYRALKSVVSMRGRTFTS